MSCGFRWWWRATGNLVLLVILAIPLRGYYRAETETAAPRQQQTFGQDQAEIRFISFNLLAFQRQPDETRQALEAANPDMLLLLEFTPGWQKSLKPVLDKYEWKIGLPQSDSFGIWFGSKRKLTESRLVVVGDGPFPTVVAQVEMNGLRLGVVGAHPMNPVFPSWSRIWREQYGLYPDLVNEVRGDAVIFAGDLNSSPFAATFRQFLSQTGLRDSALGRGVMNTWSGPRLPVELGLPIDHILLGGRISVLDLKRGPQLGSDHRWLEARLRVEPRPAE
jgi:endonuclease/exonuclease/phosphatase (EEP) superfamily protein YafD